MHLEENSFQVSSIYFKIANKIANVCTNDERKCKRADDQCGVDRIDTVHIGYNMLQSSLVLGTKRTGSMQK